METLPTRQRRKSLFDDHGTSESFNHEAKDEFELLEMNLPGLCRGEDDDNDNNIALDSSQYRAAADAVSRQNLRTELLKQVREKPWFLSQRHLAYQNHHHMPRNSSRRRNSMNEESFSYAKALVDSDAELERFSQEISSQLHLTEMMEVAVRAQQAADEGCETFSASMASFVPEPAPLDSMDERRSDAEAGEQQHHHHHSGPIVAASVSEEPTISSSSQAAAPFRHIAEVIPNFDTMNAHMRTHLYRKKVDKKTLIFEEVEESERKEQNNTYNLSPRSQGTEITADFFKNLSGYFGKRVRSQESEAEKDVVHELLESSSDENDNDCGSLEEHFPLDLGAPSIPSVGSLASLNSLTVKPSRRTTVPTIFTDNDDDEGEATSISTPPPSPTTGSSSLANANEDQTDFVKETLEILNTVSSSTGPTETDHGSTDDHDGSHSSCPSSPFQGLGVGDQTPLPLEITQTGGGGMQKQEDTTTTATKSPHDYNTPKRLRVLRQSDGGEPSCTSPDPRLNFSPSSIIASSVGAPSSVGREGSYEQNAFLKEHTTRHLEIPRIGEKPQKNPKADDLTPSPTNIEDVAEKAKRTRRIRMLRRRLDSEDTFSSETREGNATAAAVVSATVEGGEAKIEGGSLLDKSPTEQTSEDSTEDESNNVSLVPRPQPEEALVYLPEKEDTKVTMSLAVCGQEKSSVAGIPMILPSSPCCAGDDSRSKRYFKETKNDEYMNNYFYLSRLGGSDRRDIDRQNYRRFICDETIADKTGVLCQDVGTTCNDLDYLFLGTSNNNNNNNGAQNKASSPARAVASQAPWWFSHIGMGFIYGSAEKKKARSN